MPGNPIDGVPVSYSDAAQQQSPNLSENNRSSQSWPLFGLFLLALLFTLVIFYFLINKHNAFNTRTYNFARFSQAIWNVLDGRFLFSSVDYRSILGNHFSPYMALLAPLLLIWPDERALLFAQAASVAVTGLFLALILYDRHPLLAPWFLLSFYLNPAVQSLTLVEFRRVVLVMPFLALALLALHREKRPLMLAVGRLIVTCPIDHESVSAGGMSSMPSCSRVASRSSVRKRT